MINRTTVSVNPYSELRRNNMGQTMIKYYFVNLIMLLSSLLYSQQPEESMHNEEWYADEISEMEAELASIEKTTLGYNIDTLNTQVEKIRDSLELLRDQYDIADTIRINDDLNIANQKTLELERSNVDYASIIALRQVTIDSLNRANERIASENSRGVRRNQKLDTDIKTLQRKRLELTQPKEDELRSLRNSIRRCIESGDEQQSCASSLQQFKSLQTSLVFQSRSEELKQDYLSYKSRLDVIRKAKTVLQSEYQYNSVKNVKDELIRIIQEPTCLNQQYLHRLLNLVEDYCHITKSVWTQIDEYMVDPDYQLNQSLIQSIDADYIFLRTNLLNQDGTIKDIQRNFISDKIETEQCQN